MRHRFSVIAILVFAVLSFATLAARASDGGSISGRVKDASGSSVANAVVELVEVDTNKTFSVHADGHGYYKLPVLPVGRYTLTVKAPGFAEYQRTEIVLNTSDALTIDAPLAIASQSDTVTVVDTPAHLDPDNTTYGEVISGRQMTAVPLDGRSFTDLLSLQAGVVPQTSVTSQTVQDVGATQLSPSGTQNPGTISINGQREFANAFVVNGADVEEDVNSGTAIVPNLDSIDQFRILISNFDSEYGGYSGGQIKVVTKSGSNRFHGSAFDFLRNTDLDARNYFSPTRATFNQNQYGGTFGGPIRKDRLFFFADYQGTRQTMGVDTNLIPVPTVADRTGNLMDTASGTFFDPLTKQPTSFVSGPYLASLLSQELGYTVAAGEEYYAPGCTTSAQCVLPNAVIPQVAFSLPAQHLLQYIPNPNSSDGQNFSTSAQKQILGDNKGAIRTDYDSRLGRLSAYYFIDNYNLDNPYPVAQSGASVPGFNALNTGRAQLATLSLVTPIGEKTVNEAHVSYMRDVNDLGQPVGGLGVSLQSQGFVDANGDPTIYALAPNHVGVENVIFNNYSIGTAANELRQVNNTVEATEDVSRIVGRHTLRAGFSFHHDEVDGYPIAGFNGNFQFTGTETGSDFADFLLGVPTAFNQSQLNPFYGRDNYYGAYGQDSWRVNNSVVLNYGVRYDRIAPWSEEHNEISVFRAGVQSIVFPGAPAGILYPGDPGVPRTLSPAGDEFSPRVGISYSPHPDAGSMAEKILGADGKTTIRAGFGSYYTAFEATTLGVLAANAPYGTTYTSPLPSLFQNPFITASTGQNLGQQFPVHLAPTGASRSNPNANVNWGEFTPISGIPGFSSNNRVPYVEEYTASVERQLSKALTVSVTYTGNTGHRLLAIEEANPGNPALCLSLSQASQVSANSPTCGPTLESSVFTTAGGTVINGTRGPLGPNFGSNASQLTKGFSSYNAGEINVHYMSPRLEVIGAYTYAKSLDQASNVGDEINPIDPALSYGLSSFDIRHNFVVSYNYELPFEDLLQNQARLTKGWRFSGITHISTGFPVTLVNNSDNSLLGTLDNGINNFFVDLPQTTGESLSLNHNPRGSGVYFNPNALTFQPLGTNGDAKRRYFSGPGEANFDMALQKSIPIKEEKTVELRFESFNVFNHTQFFGPTAVSGTLGSSNFGEVTSASAPRICQAALRFVF
jgi:hypothetical protein